MKAAGQDIAETRGRTQAANGLARLVEDLPRSRSSLKLPLLTPVAPRSLEKTVAASQTCRSAVGELARWMDGTRYIGLRGLLLLPSSFSSALSALRRCDAMQKHQLSWPSTSVVCSPSVSVSLSNACCSLARFKQLKNSHDAPEANKILDGRKLARSEGTPNLTNRRTEITNLP